LAGPSAPLRASVPATHHNSIIAPEATGKPPLAWRPAGSSPRRLLSCMTSPPRVQSRQAPGDWLLNECSARNLGGWGGVGGLRQRGSGRTPREVCATRTELRASAWHTPIPWSAFDLRRKNEVCATRRRGMGGGTLLPTRGRSRGAGREPTGHPTIRDGQRFFCERALDPHLA